MTNGTIMSRRGCVEKITILPDGTVPPVEMTSLGFQESLSPYETVPADTACVLKGGALITEKNVFERVITNIQHGCIFCWTARTGRRSETAASVTTTGWFSAVTKIVTGRHALYFRVTTDYEDWMGDMFRDRNLFELKSFVFLK